MFLTNSTCEFTVCLNMMRTVWWDDNKNTEINSDSHTRGLITSPAMETNWCDRYRINLCWYRWWWSLTGAFVLWEESLKLLINNENDKLTGVSPEVMLDRVPLWVSSLWWPAGGGSSGSKTNVCKLMRKLPYTSFMTSANSLLMSLWSQSLVYRLLHCSVMLVQ